MSVEYIVDKPFPGPVPSREGAILELTHDGLVCLIQMPGLTRDERRAFKKSFKNYSYLETDTSVPIGIWVFNFSAPHGPIDCNFNAAPVKPEYINNYLVLENGQIKNVVTFYLLDQKILKGIKLVGLRPAAVEAFHITIRKQLALSYRQSDYDRCLSAIYNYDSDELFKLGKTFKK